MLLCFSRIIGYVGPWSTVAGLWQMRNPPATRKLFIHYFVGNVLQKVQRHSWIYFTFAISVTCVPCEEILEIILNPSSCLHFSKGRMATPKWMNFRKISKRPLTPQPHFRKWCSKSLSISSSKSSASRSKICNINFWNKKSWLNKMLEPTFVWIIIHVTGYLTTKGVNGIRY